MNYFDLPDKTTWIEGRVKPKGKSHMDDEKLNKTLEQLRQSGVELKQIQGDIERLLDKSRATSAEIQELANTSKDRERSRFDPIEATLKRHDETIIQILEILKRLT
jgi:hypothetical protein